YAHLAQSVSPASILSFWHERLQNVFPPLAGSQSGSAAALSRTPSAAGHDSSSKNAHRTHASLNGILSEPGLDGSESPIRIGSDRWQKYCRGLYQTPSPPEL